MFSNNEKGITMLSLVITLFMIAIVSGTIIYYSRTLGKTAKIEYLKSNMLLIQAQAKIISEKYNYDNTSVEIPGTIDENGFYILDDEKGLIEIGLEELANKIKEEKRNNSDYKEYYRVRYAIDEYKGQDILVEYYPGMNYEGTKYSNLSQIKSAEL